MNLTIAPYVNFLYNEGIGETARRLCSSIAWMFYQNTYLTLYQRDFTKNISGIRIKGDEVLIREFFPDELPYFVEFMFKDINELTKRFKSGMRCFVAEYQGSFAGYLWVTSKDEYIPEISDWFRVPDRSVYIFNVRVLKKFRKKGIFSLLLEHVCDALQETNFMHCYAAVVSTNVASAMAFEKCGFKQWKSMHFVNILGSKKYSVTTY